MSSLLPTTPEAASAGAELVTSDGRSLALTSARLVGEAQGGLARLVLEQRFENTYDENLRVTYRMPLPADGAVSGYEFVIGERTIKGAIDRKAQARERFERAIASGKTAALLEQERADIFTQQIGNIPAREAVVARITIDQRLVWLPEGEWELRFPTVIGPRYIGTADSAADVRATHIKVTDQPLRAGIQIALTIRDAIVGGGTASSPSHRVERSEGGAVALHSTAKLDRDIVLRWPVATPTVGLSLAAARREQDRDAFGLLTIVPPARDAKPVAVPRDLIVLIDTSGSMSGGPLDKAKQVIAMMLDSLDEQDRFELIEFSNEPRRYREEPTMATAKAKQAAIKWVRSRQADGATEMRAAVIEALTTLRVGAQRQVVVVTDGYVGGEQQILEALNRRLPKSCRVHVLGVGSAVNRSLATSLARAGRGVEVIVGVDEDAERGAKRLLDRTRMPIVANVEISGSALLRHAPALIPDVFEGAPLVAALALRAEGGELVVRGQLARESWEQTIRVPAQQPGAGNAAIVALYGRERVADVEATALFSTVDGEIEELGLQFQISTRMTSWVAIDETRRVTGPSRDQLIPQELPYGTSAAAFGLRGSAPQMRATRTAMGVMKSGAWRDASVASSLHSINPVVSDEMDGDFGEEAPGEPAAPDASYDLLRARRSASPLSAPPPPARPAAQPGYPPAGYAARPPQLPETEREDDAFATEEPTGRQAYGAAAAPEMKKEAEERPATLRGLIQNRQKAARSADPALPKPVAPASKTTMMVGSAPRPTEQPPQPGPLEMRRMQMPEPLPARVMKRRTSWIPWVIALLAVIAVLLWWLLA